MMKYIKYFENKLLDDEIFIHLKDNKFNVTYTDINKSNYPSDLIININKFNVNFQMSEVKDDINFIVDYLNSEYELDKIIILFESGNEYYSDVLNRCQWNIHDDYDNIDQINLTFNKI